MQPEIHVVIRNNNGRINSNINPLKTYILPIMRHEWNLY